MGAVEKRQKREGLLERTAQVLDLPGDVVAGLPREIGRAHV